MFGLSRVSHANLHRLLLLLLPAAFSLLLYAPIIGDSFVYDDLYHITSRLAADDLGELVQHLSPTYARSLGELTYRPLTSLSYMLVYQGFGDWEAAHYGANVLLHALVVLLLTCWLRRLDFSPAAAAFGALVFSLHPINVGTVALIGFREEHLIALFGLGGLLLLTRSRRSARVGGLALLGVGVLAKEIGAAFGPTTIYLTDREGPARWWRAVAASAVCVAVTVGLLLANRLTVGLEMSKEHVLPFFQRLAFAGQSIGCYLQRLFYWRDISLLHDDLPLPDFSMPIVWFGLFALAVAVVVAVRGLWRPSRGAWATTLAFLALLPTLNLLLPLWVKQADRFLYVPMLGLAAGAAWAVERIGKWAASRSENMRRVSWAVALTLLLVLVAGALREVPRYRDGLSLYGSIHARQPGSEIAAYSYAMELLRAERADEATALIEPLYAKYSDQLRMARVMAECYAATGQPERAIEVLRHRQFIGEDGSAAVVTLQYSLLAAGRQDEALALTRKLADNESMPQSDRHRLLLNAARALIKLGEYAQARGYIERVLDVDPRSIPGRALMDRINQLQP